MRIGWHGAIGLVVGLLMLGGGFGDEVAAAASSPILPVRLTVEIDWRVLSPTSAADVELDLPGGRVLDAITWPAERGAASQDLDGTSRLPGGRFKLGKSVEGRSRVRVEGPLSSFLQLRVGGHVVRVPLTSLLNGRQHTAAGSPFQVGMERLPWDALEVQIAQFPGTVRGESPPVDEAGIVRPGAALNLTVGLNIQTLEPADAVVTLTTEVRPIRGGDPIWRDARQTAIKVGTGARPRVLVPLAAPREEGLYQVVLQATWEPAREREESRLSRLLKRRKPVIPGSTSSRRMVLAVMEPKVAGQGTTASSGERPSESSPSTSSPIDRTEPTPVVVDQIDWTKSRAQRAASTGRVPAKPFWEVPESALVPGDSTPRWDRLRGWIPFMGSTGPPPQLLAAADTTGVAWSSVALKVPHPGSAHELTITVVSGHPSVLAVALISPGGPDSRRRILLDTCASGHPVLETGPPAVFRWRVWPEASAPVLILANRGRHSPVKIGSVELAELGESPAPSGAGAATTLAVSPSQRRLAISLAGSRPLDRFGAGNDAGPDDLWTASGHLAEYLKICRADVAILPDSSLRRLPRDVLDGQAGEDALGPEPIDLVARRLERTGLAAWIELDPNETLPNLPAPSSAEARARGVVQEVAAGLPAVYQPLHPEVRAAWTRRVAEMIAPQGRPRLGVSGLVVRLGPGGTLAGPIETMLPDDATYERFVKATFDPQTAKTVPGLSPNDPYRAQARRVFLNGPGRTAWSTWRAREIGRLYAELALAARARKSDAVLAVATPSGDSSEGSAAEALRRADREGNAPDEAWNSVGLNLAEWPKTTPGLLVLRGTQVGGVGPDDSLSRDLATSPELDEQVARMARNGAWLDVGLGSVKDLSMALTASSPGNRAMSSSSSQADSPEDGVTLELAAPDLSDRADPEVFGSHALAALDASWLVVSNRAVEGREPSLRRVVQLIQMLPLADRDREEARIAPARHLCGVAAWTVESNGQTFLALANDLPFPLRLDIAIKAPKDAEVFDVPRDAKLAPDRLEQGFRLVLDVEPSGISLTKVTAPGIKVETITPYPPPTVQASLRQQADLIANRLEQLTRGELPELPAVPAAPANSGGELTVSPALPPDANEAATTPTTTTSTAVPGWVVLGDRGATLRRDTEHPRSGQACLRLDAPQGLAGLSCEPFSPPLGQSITLKVWLRSARAQSPVRLWLEGEGGLQGGTLVRQTELTVPTEWMPITVQARDLPTLGLDRLRLRFELMTPGTLWLDDISLEGSGLSEPTRRQARRVLFAALQAYREGRFADFNRLAESHWAKQAELELARRAETVSTSANPSALPAGRGLR